MSILPHFKKGSRIYAVCFLFRDLALLNNGFLDDTDLFISEINAPTLNFSKGISGNNFIITYCVVLVSYW